VIRRFSLVNHTHPTSGRDDDVEHELVVVSACGSARLWYREGERLRDKQLTDDVKRLKQVLGRIIRSAEQGSRK
jgi:hypothetical protein